MSNSIARQHAQLESDDLGSRLPSRVKMQCTSGRILQAWKRVFGVRLDAVAGLGVASKWTCPCPMQLLRAVFHRATDKHWMPRPKHMQNTWGPALRPRLAGSLSANALSSVVVAGRGIARTAGHLQGREKLAWAQSRILFVPRRAQLDGWCLPHVRPPCIAATLPNNTARKPWQARACSRPSSPPSHSPRPHLAVGRLS